MKTYLVTWEIELDAEDPEQAAHLAHRIQKDQTSLATYFKVRPIGEEITVDAVTGRTIKKERK